MTQLAIILWLANLVVDTGGQLSFKMAASQGAAHSGLSHWKYMGRRPWIWIGVGFYVAEFFVWMAFLSEVELSVGVMLGSFNIVAIMVAGRILFNERFTLFRTAGVFLITCGVAVVGLGQ